MRYLVGATPFVALLWLSCAGRSDVDLGHSQGGGGDDSGAATGGSSGLGAAAGTVGSGASAGSSDAGADNPANVFWKKVSMVCSVLAATQCSVSACLADLMHDEREAELYECKQELLALLDCTTQHPFICTAQSPGYLRSANSACQGQADTHAACLPVCGESSATTSNCAMTCTGKSTWAVECHVDGMLLQCVCTKGPKAGTGTSFPGSCLGLDMRMLLDDGCA